MKYELSLQMPYLSDNIYKLKKSVIIGTSESDWNGFAYDIIYTKDIKAKDSLTFSLLRTINTENDLETNYLTDIIHNESQLQLRVTEPTGDKIYTYVVKKIDESREKRKQIFKYTASSYAAEELGRQGYEITFNETLGNNTGYVEDFIEEIFPTKESYTAEDWQPIYDADEFYEKNEEILYETYLSGATITSIIGNTPSTYSGKAYIFVTDKESEVSEKQYIIPLRELTIVSNKVVDTDLNYLSSSECGDCVYAGITADRYVEAAKTKYDSNLSQVVKICSEEISNRPIYAYDEYESIITGSVSNLLSNSNNFTDSTGWVTQNYKDYFTITRNTAYATLSGTTFTITNSSGTAISNYNYNLVLTPSSSSGITVNGVSFSLSTLNLSVNSGTLMIDTTNQTIITSSGKQLTWNSSLNASSSTLVVTGAIIVSSCFTGAASILSYTANSGSSSYLCNLGLYSSATKLYPDKTYILQVKGTATNPRLANIKFSDYSYTIDGTAISPTYTGTGYYIFTGVNIENPGLFFNVASFSVTDVQFFMAVESTADELNTVTINGTTYLTPLTVPTARYELNTRYYYYPNDTDTEPTYITNNNYTYLQSYHPVRTYETSESTKYQIAQDLCELFQCYFTPIIEYDDTGIITARKAQFSTSAGSYNSAGITYDVNLKGNSRNIDSNNITTKMYVKPIENQYANNGYCTIENSAYNGTARDYIINFSYFAKKGLINNTDWISDVYGSGILGQIGDYAAIVNPLIEARNLAKTAAEITLPTQIEGYQATIDSINQQIYKYNQQIKNGVLNSSQTPATYVQLDADKKASYKNTIDNLNRQKTNSLVLMQTAQTNLQVQLDKLEEYNAADTVVGSIAYYQKLIEELQTRFDAKYAYFIKEGVWTGENEYISDDEYYFDALKVSTDSANPRVTYSISVALIGELEGYEAYNYSIGDITYVEDKDFFGYNAVSTNGAPTLYREEVIITKISTNLSEPSQSTIEVQNYFTSFDDLFQRIEVSVQTLSLNENIYHKADNFTANGEVDSETIQKTLLNNNLIIQQSNNQSCTLDSNGLLLKDVVNPNKQLKAIASGIFLTDTGGFSWSTGITPSGINANMITAGELTTDKVTIMNGSNPAFLWKADGLFAYFVDSNGTHSDRFVRFNSSGLLAQNGSTTVFELTSEGNLKLTGNITATSGYIGDSTGFSINSTYIANGKNSLTDTNSGIYLGTNGIALGASSVFKVTSAGALTAKSGAIGGWTIMSDYLKSFSGTLYLFANGDGTDNINGSSLTNLVIRSGSNGTGKFGVTSAGDLYASNANISGTIISTNATITGNITATSGYIGSENSGFDISTNGIYNTRDAIYTEDPLLAKTGIYISAERDSSSPYRYGAISLGSGNASEWETASSYYDQILYGGYHYIGGKGGTNVFASTRMSYNGIDFSYNSSAFSPTNWFTYKKAAIEVTPTGAYLTGTWRFPIIDTPITGTTSGTTGEIKFSTEYMYICTSPNIWKRVALSSF
jgi:hypothetical protein